MNLNTTAKDSSSRSAATLTFSKTATDNDFSDNFVFVGKHGSLTSSAISTLLGHNQYASLIDAMLQCTKGGSGTATSFAPAGNTHVKLTVIVLPSADKITRNNHTFSPHALTDHLNEIGLQRSTSPGVVEIFVIDDNVKEYMCCVAAAVARALPLYHSKSKKSSSDDKEMDDVDANFTAVNISFYNGKGIYAITNNGDSNSLAMAQSVADGVRLAGKLGDMPPAELNPTTYSGICKDIASKLAAEGKNVTFKEIVGEQLKDGGYGGIYGVGMAAQCPPRMVVMTYTPKDGEYTEHVAMCGKGVIYDTGGLSLKPKVGMCGMKHDMGGSAGLLGGFMAAVQLGVSRKITLILAIVENAIGPYSFRNDDILTMKSGKTVEINNTDAEGRLILSDCVSYASNCLDKVDVIVDMATLTGAQGIATGDLHAGVLAKTKTMEDRIYKAGLATGDLCFPLLYAPELLKKEFNSKVADMKNSVKNRSNAQTSCAGHFIESHIDESYEGDWVHVDMAYPDHKNERATGYGVALVVGLLEAPGCC